jgi:hypothetical protein
MVRPTCGRAMCGFHCTTVIFHPTLLDLPERPHANETRAHTYVRGYQRGVVTYRYCESHMLPSFSFMAIMSLPIRMICMLHPCALCEWDICLVASRAGCRLVRLSGRHIDKLICRGTVPGCNVLGCRRSHDAYMQQPGGRTRLLSTKYGISFPVVDVPKTYIDWRQMVQIFHRL